ncbi:hypothetical protein [Martelella soudanensis]|nr:MULTISPECIES: hypothetical protein [unclassified Martelella]
MLLRILAHERIEILTKTTVEEIGEDMVRARDPDDEMIELRSA